ncbi:peptidoglycan-binding protein LysM [Chitinophagales bacterium]|nr:peptidoglycan-binding protein LysM [Chitinophagales bacterium]
MGLFSFVKNAGARLFGKKEEEVAAVAPSQEELDSRKADQLLGLIDGLGFKVDSLFVAVEDDVATIAGTALNQADREKVILAVGNVEGISQVDDQMKVPVPEPVAQFHTVVSGDSLSGISKKYYGSYNKYMHIFEANQPMLKTPDLIYPGQVLRIPELSA